MDWNKSIAYLMFTNNKVKCFYCTYMNKRWSLSHICTKSCKILLSIF